MAGTASPIISGVLVKSVIYSTCTELLCKDTAEAPIIVCLASDTLLANGQYTFEAVLLNATQVCGLPCNQNTWRYNIQYDEELLEDPETLLTADDIKAIFCLDSCFIKWTQENFYHTTARGTFTANGTTAVVIADTNVKADSIILWSLKTVGGTPEAIYEFARTVDTSFQIKSAAGNTSVYNYVILEFGV